jgi:hypothetical protein
MSPCGTVWELPTSPPQNQEITMNTKIKTAAIAVAVAGLFSAPVASADTLTFNGFSDGSVSASITSPISESASAGGFAMTNATHGGSFVAWCADIFHNMATTQSYTLTSGASFYATDTGKATALSELATHSLSSVTGNATNSAAFQLAVWEIVNETSGHGYSLSGGNFKATSDAAVLTAANNMLGNLSGPITMTASVWAQNTPGSTQDLVVFAPVPEPETYAMMLSGLGLMGFVARRRKQVPELA